jgi:xylose isomerase
MTYFPDVPERIPYEGPGSKAPFAFKHYDADAVIEGRTMSDWLRFSVCYWHTFRATGVDPFGSATLERPWDDGSESIDNAKKRVDVAFDFISRLGVPYYCFHDRDVAPDGATLAEANANLDAIAAHLKEAQDRTGIKLLWGTANLFSEPPQVATRMSSRMPLLK